MPTITEEDLLCLKEIVEETQKKLAGLVVNILEREYRKTGHDDPNYPVFLSERIVNNFVLNLLTAVYQGNTTYAYEEIIRNEIQAQIEYEKKLSREKERGIGG